MNRMKRAITTLLSPALVFSILSAPSAGFADMPDAVASATATPGNTEKGTDYASPERQEAALGHYARARALLVEALAEFEEARAVARPDMLIDPEEWRLMVISKTEDLNRLLDPQPRVTRSGVRFKASKSLLRTDRGPARASYGTGPQDSNYAGEEQMSDEKRLITTTPGSPSALREEKPKLEVKPEEKATAKVLVSPRETKETEETLSKIKKLQDEMDSKAIDSAKDEAFDELSEAPQPTPATPKKTSSIESKKMDMTGDTLEPEAAAPVAHAAQVAPISKDVPQAAEKISKEIDSSEQENLEISQAIEDAIKARLQKVDSMGGKPADTKKAGTSQ